MRRGGLDAAPRGGYEPLDGGGVQPAGEFLFFGFDAWDDGDGEQVGVDPAVEVEDLADFGVGFGFGEVCGVAFLPEEFARAEEGLWRWVRVV